MFLQFLGQLRGFLRDELVKKGENSPTLKNVKFSNFFAKLGDSHQNQNYPSRCTTNHKNFGPMTKTTAIGIWPRPKFWPENRFFDHSDKRCCSSMSFWDENLFWCLPLWSRLAVVPRKKNFWNWKIFRIKNCKNVNFLQRTKKVSALTGPPFLMISLKLLGKNLQHIKKLDDPFWFKLKYCIFKILRYRLKNWKFNFLA